MSMNKYPAAELILMLVELLLSEVAVNGQVKSQKTKWRRFEGRGLLSLATWSLVQETRDRSSCMSRCASLSECSGFSFRESERKCTLSLCGRIKMVMDPLGDLYLKGVFILWENSISPSLSSLFILLIGILTTLGTTLNWYWETRK